MFPVMSLVLSSFSLDRNKCKWIIWRGSINFLMGCPLCHCDVIYQRSRVILFFIIFDVSFFHGYDEFRELICSQSVGLHSSVGGPDCTANVEAMGLNPVEALKTFFGLTLRLLKLQLQLRWSHLHFIGTSLCLQYKPCSTIVKYFFRKRKTWFYIWFYFTLFYLLL